MYIHSLVTLFASLLRGSNKLHTGCYLLISGSYPVNNTYVYKRIDQGFQSVVLGTTKLH